MTSQSTCHHCHAALSGRGPQPADGVRFCMRRACRAAKGRHLRRVTPDGPVKMEARPCCVCLDPMVERPTRETDHPKARWCRRRRCQEVRADQLRAEREGPEALSMLFAKAIHSKQRVECPKCGLHNAIPGWGHPVPGTQGQQGCDYMGMFFTNFDDVTWAWIEEYVQDPEQQKKMHDTIARQKERARHHRY